MKISNKWLLAALLPVFASCGNQNNQLGNELAIPVSVQDVKKSSIGQYVSTTGTANAASEATLNTEMAGNYYLQRNAKTGHPFRLGDKVQKGQVIVKLEDEEYKNGVSLETKKLNYEIAKLEYEKQQSLYEKGGVTLREVKNSEVSLSQAKQDYENAQLQLAKMNVKAPVSGILVTLPNFTNGTRVASGTAVATIMDYNTLNMEVNLPEKNLSTVKVGQEVNITNYTLPEDTLTGRISELSPVVSSETRTFTGKIRIDNPELKLRPGMFVKADIQVARMDSAIVIPKDIIVSGNRGKTVYIVVKGAAQQRVIETGLENDNQVQVVSGLKANDRVVTKGFETLRNRSKVKVVK
ncbi:efflux RND transporter periplasmic adaptor subunit [Prolixibacter sp. SD074]|jgi:RND family efflux transporter MFP subunit|uniref:efflux RND transporter periplasmic adaptor subunit n=1 Tax=Prolixibacter sp. SD074 TaxID=2652391 RepID=UPI001271078B|nr:efflux RND transporter periplasmic adaptor subunit [Prolixibacter sp. SD074]GET29233.1 hemolysin D [Prolixibacter sp. SD074]